MLLHSYDLKKVFYGLGSGLRQNLSWDDFRYLPCLVPPLDEQRAIACYLDHMDRRIQLYIEAKEHLISLLQEARQAIIQHAVTRGLDPDVPLKPSGVDWLGDVPAHWEVRRLKFWVRINEADLSDDTAPDYTFRYVEIGAVRTGVLIEEPREIRFAVAPSRARRIVRKGDTIVSTVRTYLKAVWFADLEDENLICSTGFAVLTPGQRIEPRFLKYLAQSNSFTDRMSAESVGTTYPGIAEGKFSSFHICIPPLSEQRSIAAHLDQTIAAIDSAIDNARCQVEFMREYRSSLIAHVVIGKLDVCAAAAQLPAGNPAETPVPEQEKIA